MSKYKEMIVVNLILNGLCSLLELCNSNDELGTCRKPYSKWTMFSTISGIVGGAIGVVNLILNGLCSLPEKQRTRAMLLRKS